MGGRALCHPPREAAEVIADRGGHLLQTVLEFTESPGSQSLCETSVVGLEERGAEGQHFLAACGSLQADRTSVCGVRFAADVTDSLQRSDRLGGRLLADAQSAPQLRRRTAVGTDRLKSETVEWACFVVTALGQGAMELIDH